MKINQFQKELFALFDRDECGLYQDIAIELYPHIDTCLGCTYKGTPIPCEGVPWDKALDIIIEFIKNERKQ